MMRCYRLHIYVIHKIHTLNICLELLLLLFYDTLLFYSTTFHKEILYFNSTIMSQIIRHYITDKILYTKI